MKYFLFAAIPFFGFGAPFFAHAATLQYSWAAQFIVNYGTANGAGGTGRVSQSARGGPFDTQEACFADFASVSGQLGETRQAVLNASIGNGGFTCTCDSPISEQGPQCPGYSQPGSANSLGPQTSNPPAATSPAPAPGATFTPIAPIPGLDQGLPINSSGIAVFLNNLYKYLIGLAAVLAVIMTIWGGFEIATKDSVPLKMRGKERIYQALFGLVLVLAPALVFSVINPSILNLSVNIPPIDLSTTPTPAAPETPGTCVDTGSGIGACIQKAEDDCTKNGGVPHPQVDPFGGRTVVTCSPAPAPGTALTPAACGSIPGAILTARADTCAGAPSDLVSYQKSRNYACADLTPPGTGVCLYNPSFRK